MDIRTTFSDPALGASTGSPLPRRSWRRRPRAAHPSPFRRALRVVAVVTVPAVLLTAVGGWLFLHHWASEVPRITGAFGATDERPADDATTNILVLGSDSREGLTRAERRELATGRAECDCTDTLMLVQLAHGDTGASVVSFPRDLMVTTPAWTDADGKRHAPVRRQINAAYAAGGAALTVATVEALTEVRVDHVLQVRFSGVVRVVDALDGVDVCVPRTFSDDKTRLALERGTHRLDGVDALKYVRLRSVGTGSDLDRIRRQQQFLASALSRATSLGVLADPGRVRALLDSATRAVAVDAETGDTELLRLANRLRSLDRSTMVMLTVPNEPYPADRNRVQLAQPAADRVFAALRGERPPAATEKGAGRQEAGKTRGGTPSEHRSRADRPRCEV
jgi:LCP family protein required for cell wall assembly